jgi:hypothetical protein
MPALKMPLGGTPPRGWAVFFVAAVAALAGCEQRIALRLYPTEISGIAGLDGTIWVYAASAGTICPAGHDCCTPSAIAPLAAGEPIPGTSLVRGVAMAGETAEGAIGELPRGRYLFVYAGSGASTCSVAVWGCEAADVPEDRDVHLHLFSAWGTDRASASASTSCLACASCDATGQCAGPLDVSTCFAGPCPATACPR